MPKTYSKDFRHQVMRCVERSKSYEEVCEFFSISRATLYRWISQLKKTGSLEGQKRGFYHPRKVDRKELQAYLSKNADATLEEISRHFNCSSSAICQWFKKLGITRKKNHSLQRKKRKRA